MPLLYFMHENISNRPDPKSTGRPRIYPLREILNAFFYVVRSGCLWRLVPHDDFPPWRSLYHYFRESSTWMEHRRGCTPHCASG
jgi:transposase